MRISDIELRLIKDELTTTRDHGKVARRLGLPIKVIREVDIDICGRHVQTEDRGGAVGLRKFVIATKHIDEVWPTDDVKIIDAQKLYDRGVVEICTGRDGFRMILYAIPRQEKDVKRTPYFSRTFGDQ